MHSLKVMLSTLYVVIALKNLKKTNLVQITKWNLYKRSD
jgi:hypothetical protein